MIKILENKEKCAELWIGQVQSGKTSAILEYIRNNYSKYKIIIYLSATNNLLLDQSNRRIESFIESFENNLKLVKYDESFSTNLTYYLLQNKTYLFSILKQTTNLQKIIHGITEVVTQPIDILIIDDESDYASTNIATASESEIFKLIKRINQKNEFINTKFISVTATPFANILTENVVEYEKLVILQPKPGYFGSEDFIKNDKYIFEGINNKNENNNCEEIFKSLIVWIFSTAIMLSENNVNKSEFLINIDSLKQKHNQICKIVIQELENLYKNIDNSSFFKDYYNIYKSLTKNNDEINIDKLKQIIKKNLFNTSIRIINGENNETYRSGNDNFVIIIGGNIISRGFTFENLITELILNSPLEQPSMDTMLQRARWFGYREKIFKYMNVVMTKDIYNAYIEYNEILKSINYCGDISELENILHRYELSLKNIKLSNKK